MSAQFIINFPISTEHAENDYCLAVCFAAEHAEDIIAILQSDTRSFTNVEVETVSGKTNVTCVGTLTGNTQIKDDSRDNILAPICSSKLTFNMLCADFPAWLLDQCNYYTSVKVILYAQQGATKRVKWRGFLWDNALNMTVVDELQSCTLVALDEVAIAKYIKISETWTSSNRKRRTLPLLQYFSDYWRLIHTEFSKLYQQIGLTSLGKLQVNRSIAFVDDNGTEIDDFMSNVYLPNSMYYDDEKATWQDALRDIAEILGCTWLVGGYGSGDYDGYLLTSYDEVEVGETFERYVYDLINDTITHHQSSYRDITQHNPQKVGADLQITVEPAKYKGVTINSEEQRFVSHEYLKDDGINLIEGSTAATKKGIVRRWGKPGESSSRNQIDELKYHHFQYCEFKADESPFIQIEECINSNSVEQVVHDGYLPADTLDFHSKTKADREVATAGMQFVQSKIGAMPCRIGEYELQDALSEADLQNYLIIMNNNWGRYFWQDTTTEVGVQQQEGNLLFTIKPRREDSVIHPSNAHFLKIDFSAIFINETMSNDFVIISSPANLNNPVGKDIVAFPSTTTYFDEFGDETGNYNAILKDRGEFHCNSYYPYITARISVGDYYWNGSNWVHVTSGTPPTFNIPLIPSDVEQYYLASGTPHKNVMNYYYTECRPKYGATDRSFYIPILSSIHGQPFEGELKIEFYGQVPWFNYRTPSLTSKKLENNIIAVLIRDIDISFTDQAEINKEESKRTETDVWDSLSVTKEMEEVNTNLCSPLHDGMMANSMIFDNGKAWTNLTQVKYQSGNYLASLEYFLVRHHGMLHGHKPTFIEFSMFFNPWDNIHNLENRFTDFREFAGTFVPLERTFTINKDLVRYKLQLLQE